MMQVHELLVEEETKVMGSWAGAVAYFVMAWKFVNEQSWMLIIIHPLQIYNKLGPRQGVTGRL